MLKPVFTAGLTYFWLACGASAPSPSTPAAAPHDAHEHTHEGHQHDVSSAPPAGGAMHHAEHGGVVKMYSEEGQHLHVEVVVLPSGLAHLYPTDGSSKPIPPGELSGHVTCENAATHAKATADLKSDVADGSAAAQCPPLAPSGATVTFDVTLRGASFSRSVTVGASGTTATTSP